LAPLQSGRGAWGGQDRSRIVGASRPLIGPDASLSHIVVLLRRGGRRTMRAGDWPALRPPIAVRRREIARRRRSGLRRILFVRRSRVRVGGAEGEDEAHTSQQNNLAHGLLHCRMERRLGSRRCYSRSEGKIRRVSLPVAAAPPSWRGSAATKPSRLSRVNPPVGWFGRRVRGDRAGAASPSSRAAAKQSRRRLSKA
jgi:hypothetical protein